MKSKTRRRSVRLSLSTMKVAERAIYFHQRAPCIYKKSPLFLQKSLIFLQKIPEEREALVIDNEGG